MIQRIQTLYLAIAAIACILLFFFPFAQYHNDMQGTYIFHLTGVKYMMDPPITVQFWTTFPLMVLVILTFLLIAVAIFLYSKRRIQLILVNVAFLFKIILISLVLLYYIGHFERMFNAPISYQIGVFIPLVSLGLLILASRAIRKDEAMVKSAERLR